MTRRQEESVEVVHGSQAFLWCPLCRGDSPPTPRHLIILLYKWGKEPGEVRTLPAIAALDADSGPRALHSQLGEWQRGPGTQALRSGLPVTFPVVRMPPSPLSAHFTPHIGVSEASCAVRDLAVPFFAVKM